jgi:phosphoribosylglycinamide formyltransferase 1
MSHFPRLRLGVIGSSGGSALSAADECLKSAGKDIDWIVVTDRSCGLENWAHKQHYDHLRIPYTSADDFSCQANDFFVKKNCNHILLFYTRRVAAPLIEHLKVCNIHPALLPSFRGLHGVRDAIIAGTRVFGSTLHDVDFGLDTGKILAQVAAPLPAHLSSEVAEHLAYLQKVWLTLFWYDSIYPSAFDAPSMDSCGPGVVIACPGLSDTKLRDTYSQWLLKNGETYALVST